MSSSQKMHIRSLSVVESGVISNVIGRVLREIWVLLFTEDTHTIAVIRRECDDISNVIGRVLSEIRVPLFTEDTHSIAVVGREWGHK